MPRPNCLGLKRKPDRLGLEFGDTCQVATAGFDVVLAVRGRDVGFRRWPWPFTARPVSGRACRLVQTGFKSSNSQPASADIELSRKNKTRSNRPAAALGAFR